MHWTACRNVHWVVHRMHIGQYCGLYTALYTGMCTCTTHQTVCWNVHWAAHWIVPWTAHCTVHQDVHLYCTQDVHQMWPRCVQMYIWVFQMCSICVTDVSRCIPDPVQIYPRYAPNFQMCSRCISNVFQMWLGLFQMCTWAIHYTLDCTWCILGCVLYTGIYTGPYTVYTAMYAGLYTMYTGMYSMYWTVHWTVHMNVHWNVKKLKYQDDVFWYIIDTHPLNIYVHICTKWSQGLLLIFPRGPGRHNQSISRSQKRLKVNLLALYYNQRVIDSKLFTI